MEFCLKFDNDSRFDNLNNTQDDNEKGRFIAVDLKYQVGVKKQNFSHPAQTKTPS